MHRIAYAKWCIPTFRRRICSRQAADRIGVASFSMHSRGVAFCVHRRLKAAFSRGRKCLLSRSRVAWQYATIDLGNATQSIKFPRWERCYARFDVFRPCFACHRVVKIWEILARFCPSTNRYTAQCTRNSKHTRSARHQFDSAGFQWLKR